MGVHGGVSAMKSSANLRGQMGTRSGALAPTSAKLTTQYLVLDHMNNHYNKITKAKSAIDSKPPKSITTSQKARDRRTRDYTQKTGHRPPSAMQTHGTRRPHTTMGFYQDQDDIYDENLWGEVDPADEEEVLIHNIMRTTLKGNFDPDSNTQHGDGYNNYATTRPKRPGSARSHRSMASGVSRTMVQVPSKRGTYDGDVLEKRSHVFTEEKPFTPRTLKTDRKSRLSQYKYYNKLPPKETTKSKQPPTEQHQQQQQQQQQQASGNIEKQTGTLTESQRPKPKPRSSKLDRTREGPVTMNSLMFETLHSRDFSKYGQQDSGGDVPKLDISMDKDHLKWIKEQASKAQNRTNMDTMKSTTIREDDRCDTSVDFGKTGEMSLTYGTMGSSKARASLGASQTLSPEDEEAAYVKFMNDVTRDVLNRGIYTDRALRQVFKSHIARNLDTLDELRMRQITDDIRVQLDIPRYDINDDTSLTMTKPLDQTQGTDDFNLERYSHSKHLGVDPGMNNTVESMNSKASRESTEQSRDTYNFKSTEDDELYSTIRSDMNNTLTDTQTLKTYQMSIKQLDDVEEGEVIENEQEDIEEGEITHGHGAGRAKGMAHVRDNVSVASHASGSVHNGSNYGNRGGNVSNKQQNQEVAGSASHSRRGSSHTEQTANDYEDGEEEYEDEYEDDDYEDDGDDEDDDGVHQNTDPTATYRTDDDDF